MRTRCSTNKEIEQHVEYPQADESTAIKHQLFILGMIQHKGDQTKTARDAGYAPKRATEQGSQLYRKLQDYITPLVGELVRDHALHAEQVVQGLSLLGSSDIGNYCSWNKKNEVVFKDMSELTPAQRFCVESIEQKRTQWGTTIKLRLAGSSRHWRRWRSITTSSSAR